MIVDALLLSLPPFSLCNARGDSASQVSSAFSSTSTSSSHRGAEPSSEKMLREIRSIGCPSLCRFSCDTVMFIVSSCFFELRCCDDCTSSLMSNRSALVESAGCYSYCKSKCSASSLACSSSSTNLRFDSYLGTEVLLASLYSEELRP